MDTLKISICIFFVLSAATISKTTFIKYKPLGDIVCNNGLNNFCFCFKSHGGYKKVPEIIYQGKGNLDRIVVYYYRNKNTGEIKMHFPNTEKQALIPDLAFEVGDKLTTIDTNSDIYRLFDIYNNGGISPYPHELDRPILNFDPSENLNDFNIDNSISSKEGSQIISDNAEINSEEGSTIRYIINQTGYDHWDINKKQSKEVIDSIKDLLDHDYDWDMSFENKETDSSNQIQENIIPGYLEPMPINNIEEIIESDKKSNIPPYIHDKIVIINENGQNYKEWEPVEKDIEQYDLESDNQIHEWNAPSDNKPFYIIPSYEDLLENNSQTDSNSLEGTKEDELEFDYTPPDGINRYETFDIWFGKQMDRFRTYSQHDRTFNVPEIEKHILKILRDNGMHVTPEGVLEDASGMVLNVQKLNLRPILIGNTITRLFNKNTSGLLMPHNVEYLQAILVTSSNPALMLGIIPIGKTVIPSSKKNAHKPHFPYQEQTQTLKPYFPYPGQQQTHHLPQKFDWNLIKEIMAIPGKKILDSYTTVKNIPNLIKNKINFRHRPEKYINANIFGKQTASSDPVGGVSKLITLVQPYQNQHITYTKPANGLFASLMDKISPLRRSNISPSSISNESSEEDTEEYLAPRIIGGMAATSSGFPISVKGRIKEEEEEKEE